ETLWRIARKYGATPDALRTWNNMNSDIVKVGQTLKIYATKNDAAPESAKSNEEDSVPPNSERVEHVIERGETIDAIAHRYGVRRKDIAMWNRLENDSIKFGRKLVIYLPNSSEPDAVAESLEE
ncbi:MAG TPA: LysM peptidoglycan-binding domain-containing protein, partial [Candidatus Hydrogenedentes bacterium]|nr:LysM peptidoglycan-binding domain-containing protein [Candidatus Hydrogenedentota bacterium]